MALAYLHESCSAAGAARLEATSNDVLWWAAGSAASSSEM